MKSIYKKILHMRKNKKTYLTRRSKYILLFISTIIFTTISVAVTINTYSMYNRDNKDNEQYNNIGKETSNESDKRIEEEKVETNIDKKDIQEKKSDTNVNVESKNAEKNSKVISANSNMEIKLIFDKPCDGNIIKEYAKEELVYSKTMNDWRTHDGIDIRAEEGSQVRSIEAGVIESIKNDPLYGITIIIDHGQGYKSVYCNLASSSMVKVGKKVTKKQVIGGVGRTSYAEISDEAHLHFEMYKDNNNINPKKELGYN